MSEMDRSAPQPDAVGALLERVVGRLPADVARCAGYLADGELREGCADCRRRTDAPHERQVHMMPPALVAFECHARIAP
jgi:hypothetical protein